MNEIFISYAQEDLTIAKRIISGLRGISPSAWKDIQSQSSEPYILTAIRESLRRSAAVVVLLTPESAASEWINFEVGAAEALGKPIIPILIRGEDKDIESLIPESLRGIEWLDARHTDPREVARQISKAMGRQILQPRGGQKDRADFPDDFI